MKRGNTDEGYRYPEEDIYRYIELYDRPSEINEGRHIRNRNSLQYSTQNGQNGGMAERENTIFRKAEGNNNSERTVAEGSRNTKRR